MIPGRTRLARVVLGGLLLVAGAARAEAFDLEALLGRTGAIEVERAQTLCRWTERTRVEQLDSSGAVTGAVIRTYAVVARGAEPVSRTKVDEQLEGEVSRLLRQESAPQKGEPRDRLSPFHPDARPMFNLTLASRDEQAVVVSVAPREPNERRMRGTARLDPASGRVMQMNLQPSKLPTFLDRLAIDVRLAPGPCGNQPQEALAEGVGGLLFVKIHFRSRTTFTGFARAEQSPHP